MLLAGRCQCKSLLSPRCRIQRRLSDWERWSYSWLVEHKLCIEKVFCKCPFLCSFLPMRKHITRPKRHEELAVRKDNFRVRHSAVLSAVMGIWNLHCLQQDCCEIDSMPKRYKNNEQSDFIFRGLSFVSSTLFLPLIFAKGFLLYNICGFWLYKSFNTSGTVGWSVKKGMGCWARHYAVLL